MFEKLQDCLDKIHQKKPIIVNLTNYVTMDFMANCLLALGASPIMSEDEQELPELISISSAINLNLGTLNEPFMVRAEVAANAAKKLGKPIILDPVGAGATKPRTSAALNFLPFSSIVRGNASEIMALHTAHTKTLGVESAHSPQEAVEVARTLATKFNLVVVVSGAIDQLVSHSNTVTLPFGTPLMQRVTGMGCSLTSVIAAFHAITPDPFEAAHLATAYFALCGEQAARHTTTPGSFRTAFIDALYSPDLEKMRERYV